MYKACSLVLLAIIASLVIQSSATIEKSKIVIPFKNVTKIIRQYNCKVPHPTLVYIDEIEGHNQPNVAYYPQAVMVHRCSRSTGCCPTGQVCESVEANEETIDFQVLEQRQTSGRRRVEKTKVLVTVKNHTSCECNSANSWRSRRAA